MGLKCVVCGDYHTKQSKESFHRFPTNAVLRSAWLTATRRQEKDLKSNSGVCSRHFRQIDYDPHSWPVRKLLTTDVVPSPSKSYFNAPPIINANQICASSSTPKYLQDNVPLVNAVLREDNAAASNQICASSSSPKYSQDNVPLVINAVQQKDHAAASRETGDKEAIRVSQVSGRIRTVRYVGDLTEDDFSTPIERKRNLQLVLETVAKQRKKIKTLQSEKSSLEKTVNDMKDVLHTLWEHKLLQEEQHKMLQIHIDDTHETLPTLSP